MQFFFCGYSYCTIELVQFLDLECKRTITIKEKYIEESIIAFAASNRDINLTRKNNKSLEYCEISLNAFNEETNPLHPNKDLVEESHRKVMIGGTWMPTNCVALVKGNKYLNYSLILVKELDISDLIVLNNSF